MRIACLLAAGFEDSEFRVPYDRYRQGGHTVTVIGHSAGEVLVGKHARERAVATLGIDGARSESFDALFIPGGTSPAYLRDDERFIRFVRGFRDRPIFAICHGPLLLIDAELVRGRSVTAWKTVQPLLRAAGARVLDRQVVVDGGLVTSRHPGDLEAFTRESLEVLSRQSLAGARGPAPPG